VGDAGMVSQDNLRQLGRGGGNYIVCMPIHLGGEVAEAVLARPGRYQEVADNLKVKQAVVGDGERRWRYVVCHNPQEAARRRAHCDHVLAELTAELASLKQLSDQPHTKRACELRAATARTPRRAPRASFPSPGRRCAPPERLNGKFVVHSNDDALHAEDLALGSKQLVQVEQAWRTLKSGLNLRVVFHWAPHRIHAHVALSRCRCCSSASPSTRAGTPGATSETTSSRSNWRNCRALAERSGRSPCPVWRHTTV
jgi:hypothetical protein